MTNYKTNKQKRFESKSFDNVLLKHLQYRLTPRFLIRIFLWRVDEMINLSLKAFSARKLLLKKSTIGSLSCDIA
jgi:hypothetical protein